MLYFGLAILIGDQSLDVWLILAWVVRISGSAPEAAPVMTLKLPEDGSLRCRCLRGGPCLDVCELQVSNLMLAAGPTHAWYKAHFKSYPEARKALIPFIY